MFDRLGRLVSRHWVLVLSGWAVLVVGIILFAPPWEKITRDGDFAYLPEHVTSVRGDRLLSAAFPDVLSKSKVALVVSRPEGKLTGPDYEVVDQLVARFEPKADQPSPIIGVWGPDTPVIGEKLESRAGPKGQAALIVLRLRNEFMAIDNMDLIESIYQALDEIRAGSEFPKGLKLGVTGSAAVGYDMLASAEQSIRNTERTTIILVVLILLLVYRAPGLVIVPLATITVSVVVGMGLVALLTQLSRQFDWVDFKVFKTTKIFIVVILFGAGTDYCLFLISRYREELQRGLEPSRAVAAALGHVGNALAASALTTIFGLGMMVFADFGKFSNSGPAIALCLAVGLGACVTLAPALLRATGRRIFWPLAGGTISPPCRRRPDDEVAGGSPIFGAFWQRLSRVIIARPGLILMVALLLLLTPLIYKWYPAAGRGISLAAGGQYRQAWAELRQGFATPITYDLLSELQADRPSVQGTRLLRRHFVGAEIDPVTVVAYQKNGRFDTDEGEKKISRLTKRLYDLEYVDSKGKTIKKPIRSVRSLQEPLGGSPGSMLTPEGIIKLAVRGQPRSRAIYLSQVPGYAGKVTRLDLVFPYDPFSQESIRLLDHVQQELDALAADGSSDWQGTEFDFVGTTAGIRDLKTVTGGDQVRIQVLVVVAVLAVLMLILRHPVICVYLMLSVLLGYFVTLAVTELFFSWVYGATYHGLDWKVPIFLFVILIAVGADYNIYLTTRVFEEQRRLGAVEGLRMAVVRTGGIITSCGVIMAGTFASMATGTLRAMHELGFALALGVLLDTFVIRTILVPAFLALIARRKTA